MTKSSRNQIAVGDLQGLLLRMRGMHDSLQPASKRIADYLLRNSKEAKFLTISALARRIGVSESMITRFARTLGFEGFKEFKIYLAADAPGDGKELIYGEIRLKDDVKSICSKIYNNNIRALRDSLRVLDFDNVETAAELIVRADKIFFYGSGSAAVAITNALVRFYRLGLACFAYSDSHAQIVSASLLGKRDVAVGVSNSGRSADIVTALEIAKRRGAQTVCITNNLETPITRQSDVNLFTSTYDSEELSESLHSRIAELSLIDALYVVVASKMGRKAVKSLRVSGEAIRRYKRST
ncbi:MAG TPA: MurR/RpiR family transcriptional regulator [Rectinemataceae bacterium]|nr:MurR/RpiR family transcriptional regulator [Rectinemataceae bacterium]